MSDPVLSEGKEVPAENSAAITKTENCASRLPDSGKETFFIDPQGRIAYKHAGEVKAPLIEAKLDEALSVERR